MSDENDIVEDDDVEETNYREVFDAARADPDNTDDDVKFAMCEAGLPFSQVGKLFNQYMVDSGLAMSKKDKDELVQEVLDGVDLSTEESFTACLNELVEKGTSITEKKAAQIIRGYAKKNEIECFKKPAAEGRGRSGFRDFFFDMLRSNPNLTKKELSEVINTSDKSSENVRRQESFWQTVRQLANDIAAQYS